MSDPSFDDLITRLGALCREVIAPHSDAVDRDARFPTEAFAALREARFLSVLLPEDVGGMGLRFDQVGRICEVLAGACASTAMIYAMHQIQVACLLHHGLQAPALRAEAERLCREQLLMASATTELGVGGDVRRSKCAVERDGDRYTLHKVAPVISYGEAADIILVTCRANPDAQESDQAIVLVRRQDVTLKPIGEWDTLGFRGTCSLGYDLQASGPAAFVLPTPYADIHARTMHPVAHLMWSALWTGIAGDSVARARAFIRAAARRTPGQLPPGATRLAEVDAAFFSMKSGVQQVFAEYQALLEAHPGQAGFGDFGFSLRVNHLKVQASQQVVDVVGRALLVAGISGYRNDSQYSLGRHLRDAYGAAIMVNNDRILDQSALIEVALRDGWKPMPRGT
ncbi:MAG: acyl-CoA/acyl-ACP dehydrogenase [Alphaproteobacteria bacterium]|nr:acyl-CoA/acyl-ACP dehydrogenase [Alphaproteobacteria bacterium]